MQLRTLDFLPVQYTIDDTGVVTSTFFPRSEVPISHTLSYNGNSGCWDVRSTDTAGADTPLRASPTIEAAVQEIIADASQTVRRK